MVRVRPPPKAPGTVIIDRCCIQMSDTGPNSMFKATRMLLKRNKYIYIYIYIYM